MWTHYDWICKVFRIGNDWVWQISDVYTGKVYHSGIVSSEKDARQMVEGVCKKK